MSNDLIGMILSFAESLSGLSYLITACTYLLGVFFVVSALYKLKELGDHRSMMSQSMDISSPIIKMFVGAGLIWWPTLIDVTTYTFWGTSSPLSYQPSHGYELDSVIEVAFEVFRLVGIIAFIRGWYYMAKSGEQGAQQGMVGKGLTHIIGGILAYHMGATVRVFMNTFGFNV
jgi:intracellular multiplication protein IcmC